MDISQNVSTTYPDPSTLTDKEKSDYIRTTVLDAGKRLRAKHPWLATYQNHIGATIMLVSLLGMVASGLAYIYGYIPWYVCVPVTALFASFIHELEHDLIHLMYFRKNRRANNLMLALGWLARASTVSPFVRRRLHLHHHKSSGTESDLEEVGITNGYAWGWRRFLMTGDNVLAFKLRKDDMKQTVKAFIKAQKPKSKEEANALVQEQINSYSPLGKIYYAIFHFWVVAFVVWAGLSLASVDMFSWFATLMHYLNIFAVVYMLPSLLRTFCLHFISSNIHYYGDVEDGNVMQQCQVLNLWWLWPMQAFCFNFGSTHAIHHFAVKEPFYIRQWTAKEAHAVMRHMGVRFNDLGTFKRNNRFYDSSQRTSSTNEQASNGQLVT